MAPARRRLVGAPQHHLVAAAILNDDVTLAITAANAARPEGTGGTTAFTFTLARRGVSPLEHSVQWAVSGRAGPGTLPANAADFVGAVLPSGTATFAVGETSKILTIHVQADSAGELNERFAVTLSNPTNGAVVTTASVGAVIFNDDTNLSFRPSRLDQLEGNAGSNPYVVSIARNGTATGTNSVDWSFAPGGAPGTVGVTAADFVANALPTGGTLTFAPQQRLVSLTLAIAGDTAPELNESFTLTLSNPTGGATIPAPSFVAVVYDDDIIYGTSGNDTLSGTAGADLFVIGQGLDSITGGAGRDGFRFLPTALGPAASNAFTFEDFDRALGERFDLARIDAIAGTIANDAFGFIGTAPFSGAPGELR